MATNKINKTNKTTKHQNHKTQQFRLYIEGNISCGKTTFLNYFKNNPFYTILPEPLEKWQNYNGENLLELMYQNPTENTMKFQLAAQKTMFDRECQTQTLLNEIVLLERSLYSQLYVFTIMGLDSGYLTQEQYNELVVGFKALTIKLPKPDLFIYLRLAPETCYERMKTRNRDEENNVSLEYLKKLHDYHEDIFVNNANLLPAPVKVINASFDTSNMVKEVCDIITLEFCKKCSKCELPILKTNFYKNIRTKDGLQSYCNDCRREYQKPYMNKKYKDPKFYTIQKYRNRLTNFKNQNNNHHNDFLRISDRVFIEWLEFQRLENPVTGSEELDHVLPIKHYKDDPRCFEWVNIRPISKKENREKSSKIDGVEELFAKQLLKANKFLINRST